MLPRQVEDHGHIVVAVAPCPVFCDVVGVFEMQDHAVLMPYGGIWQIPGPGKLEIEFLRICRGRNCSHPGLIVGRTIMSELDPVSIHTK